jgi:UDP-glucose 4-epimerase
MVKVYDRVLVTGGAGFIGSHLVEQLVSAGSRVTVIDNLSTGKLDNLSSVLSDIELIVGDLGDLLCWNKIDPSRFECIFNLAANAYVPPSVENPYFDYQMNLRNPFLLMEALRKLPNAPRLVNISSAAVYGNPMTLPIRETDPTVPISPYGVSKLAAERYAAIYSQIYGLRVASLRFFSVYGPRQHKQVVYDLICKLIANPMEISLLGDGSQARDFNHVLDVVQAILLASTEAPAMGEVYNVASGLTISISELVTRMSAVMGVTPKVSYSGKVRPGDPDRWVVDLNRLIELGYKPQVSLDDGLRSVFNWLRSKAI